MHEWIKTGLTAINTTVLLVGAWFAYYQFIDKSDTSQATRVSETYDRVNQIPEEGGFLLNYVFDEHLAPQELMSASGLTEFGEKVDRALGSYYAIALCVESKKCDSKTVARLVCPSLMTDALVINRTLGSDIASGGLFIDRSRLWSFYEQVEFCLAVNSLPRVTPFSRPIATPLGVMDGLIHVVHGRDPRPTPRVPLRRRWRPREVPVHPRG